MITRQKVLEQAYHDCMSEMYAKAQPPADYDAIVAGVKDGTIQDTDKDPVYARHYLSQEEFKYILDKYVKAYGMEKKWDSYVGIIETYLKGGGHRDVYVNNRKELICVPHIKEAFKEEIYDNFGNIMGEDTEKLSEILSSKVLEYVQWCRDFYRVDREADSFSVSVTLGASPTYNPNTVIEYWKKHGVDIDIEWRNPLLLWEMDEYGDDFEVYMEEEYGDGWKQYWKREWEKRKDKEVYGYSD
jgi:hypothetical protein